MIKADTWCRPIIVSKDKTYFTRKPGTDWDYASELPSDVEYVEVHNYEHAVAIDIIRDPSERLVEVPPIFLAKPIIGCRKRESESEFHRPEVIRQRKSVRSSRLSDIILKN